jgi:hypothetical protein
VGNGTGCLSSVLILFRCAAQFWAVGLSRVCSIHTTTCCMKALSNSEYELMCGERPRTWGTVACRCI